HGGLRLQIRLGVQLPGTSPKWRTPIDRHPPNSGRFIMRTFVMVTISWLLSSAAFAQQASQGAQGATSIPDFSGIWARVSFPGFGRPLAGAGPVLNKNRMPNGVQGFAGGGPLINKNRSPNGVPSAYGYVGDYTNPILKPHTAEIVKKHGEIELGGTHA